MELLCENFNNLTSSPDNFLSSGHLTGELKDLLKHVYDFSQNHERTSNKALPELIVKDFDDEQIWQELELQNEDSLPNLISKVAKLVTSRNLVFPVKTKKEGNTNVNSRKKKVKEKKIKQSEAISSDEESDNDFNDNLVDNGKEYELDCEEDELDDEEYETESDEEGLLKSKPIKVKIVPSEVDDQFFKLSEAEAFLKEQEENETDLGLDLFNGMASGSDDEDRPMYNDFFDEGQQDFDESHRDSEGDVDEKEDIHGDFEERLQDGESDIENEFYDKEGKKKVKFNLDTNRDVESDSDDDEGSDEDKVKSSYEIREEKLRKKISELEDEALEEKPWVLKGEVSADVRPVNSLLEEVVEFDMTRRPAPIVTEETSNKLEDIIKRRIKDRAFNDVERKLKPIDTPNEFKKKLVLDQEKSKLSLAEVYEKEFLKQKGEKNQDVNQQEEEPEEHRIITSMMKSLFTKLDSLTNFFFVPKPVQPDLKIVNNLPAVNAEEVAPIATSDANLLAPEEIGGSYKKSLLGKEEKTSTDRKRERRKKKAYQAEIYKKKMEKDQHKPATYKEELKKALKFKNVTKMDETNTNTKSSTDFFTKLQDEISKPQGDTKKRKSKQPSKSAKKLKL